MQLLPATKSLYRATRYPPYSFATAASKSPLAGNPRRHRKARAVPPQSDGPSPRYAGRSEHFRPDFVHLLPAGVSPGWCGCWGRRANVYDARRSCGWAGFRCVGRMWCVTGKRRRNGAGRGRRNGGNRARRGRSNVSFRSQSGILTLLLRGAVRGGVAAGPRARDSETDSESDGDRQQRDRQSDGPPPDAGARSVAFTVAAFHTDVAAEPSSLLVVLSSGSGHVIDVPVARRIRCCSDIQGGCGIGFLGGLSGFFRTHRFYPLRPVCFVRAAFAFIRHGSLDLVEGGRGGRVQTDDATAAFSLRNLLVLVSGNIYGPVFAFDVNPIGIRTISE
mmetsp:Transcript_7623/g.22348  ORF Transcript_7623/g.22348 Transcript_7623/m.22348 type:complete len:333 (-) Transcript_7623:276-1274(-)